MFSKNNESYENNESTVFDQTSIDLSKVYLRKTEYQIIDQKVKQQKAVSIGQPESIIKQIQDFESGQVYEIVFKNEFTGHFISNDELAGNKFLIYILSKVVFLNDEAHTLTFIKDITFGVLYEQIKAQQELRSTVNTTLRKKIGTPLQTIINQCQSVISSKQL